MAGGSNLSDLDRRMPLKGFHPRRCMRMLETMADETRPPAGLVMVTSPIARQIAGRRWFPLYAVLRHRGRKSGTEYAIPVAVLVKPDTFVIALPWGPRTNWVQDVIAAQGGTIRWKGVDYVVTDPQLVDATVALGGATPIQRAALNRKEFPGLLALHRGDCQGDVGRVADTSGPEQVEHASGADRARADAEWGGTPAARQLRCDVARSRR